MKIFGIYFEAEKTRRRTIARECYALTHEFVTGRLVDEFDSGGWVTAHKRPTLLELDKAMKAFAASKEE